MNTHTRRSEPRSLHVLFLATSGDGLPAQLAAHWARVLAGNRLIVESASLCDMAMKSSMHPVQAGLVVAINTPGTRPSFAVHNCGGRIDWHLTNDAVTNTQVELTALMRRHVIRLLSDLGIGQLHSETYAVDASGILSKPTCLSTATHAHRTMDKISMLAA